MIKIAVRFGLLALALIGLLYLSKYSLFMRDRGQEVMIAVIALALIGLGILISGYVKKQNNPDEIDKAKIKKLGISQREYEVLSLINEGKSNLQIAELLFISESTVKTHVSNLLVKLDAKRRTEAVTQAKKMNII